MGKVVEELAEALVGSIVTRLASLAADYAAGQLRFAWGLEGDLEKLKRLLLRIQSMLADAEEKQRVDAAVRLWLDDLKKLAYEAEDVLDELNYETLRHKAAEMTDDENPSICGKVRDFFSSQNPILIRLKMGCKLNNLFEEIDKIAAESTKFNFSIAKPDPVIIDETCSFVEESEVVGRHRDKEKIVEMLIKDNHCTAKNVEVLPIVGMGGIGKTTMAKLIYNDPRVEGHFQLQVWVCISDNWDTKRIIQEILNLATKKKCELSSMEELQLALREAVAHKRFFIVLDDVWEEDHVKWDSLKDILNRGGKGSWVLVTTRNEGVAEITGTLQSFHPKCLSDDESWDLFSKTAFAPGVEKPEELVEIGMAITNKCGGLPLALKMLGRLLRMKRENSQWLHIKESNIWDTETRIIPALWLSYKHLPSHAKRCFTFCAIFPKDHDMEKEELINMWMAHDFIPSGGGRIEVKGVEIFNQLVQRSFFQIQERSISKTICRVHDLVHDLAQYIVGNECIALPKHERPQVITVPENVYHLWIPYGRLNIESTLKVSRNFRTIMSHHWNRTNDYVKMDFTGSTSLRVLGFARLPTSIKSAQHLRYLKLFNGELSELPESICTLVNLQTLDLSRCVKLLRLPKRMACMISLRHLYLDGCKELMIMAPGMGRMTNLQTLTLYVVSEEIGRGIGELKQLHLSSTLRITGLGFVKNAREMNFHSKKLTALSLDWTTGGGGEINNVEQEQVLKELKPSNCLNELDISGYGGSRFPNWMADRLLLQHLIRLHLQRCPGVHRLPPLWQLKSLEVLSLVDVDSLKYIIFDDNTSDDDTRVKVFRSLKELTMRNLGKLEEWWEKRNAPLQDEENMEICLFPALVHLSIEHCQELAGSIPLAPCLKSLNLNDSKKIPLGSISGFTSLVSLEIRGKRMFHKREEHVHDPPLIDEDKTLALRHLQCLKDLLIFEYRDLAVVWRHEDDEQEEEGHGLSSLESLKLMECDWMFLSPRLSGFWTNIASLKQLYVANCRNIVSLAAAAENELCCLKSLQLIYIWECPSLKSLGMDGLTALRTLMIFNCSALTSLPERFLPNLAHLRVHNCPQLYNKLQTGGEYWSLIANIPRRVIYN